jgi:hypothetical protein
MNFNDFAKKLDPDYIPSILESIDLDEKNVPTNPKLWSQAKSKAKAKFDVYPSAYANGWAAKWYKSKGGGWKTEESVEVEESTPAYRKMMKDYKGSDMKKVFDILKPKGFRVGEQDDTLVRNMLKKHKNDVKKAAAEIEKKYSNRFESVELDEAKSPVKSLGKEAKAVLAMAINMSLTDTYRKGSGPVAHDNNLEFFGDTEIDAAIKFLDTNSKKLTPAGRHAAREIVKAMKESVEEKSLHPDLMKVVKTKEGFQLMMYSPTAGKFVAQGKPQPTEKKAEKSAMMFASVDVEEGFSSDAQRRAAFASGYKAKGKKGKKEEVEIDEASEKQMMDMLRKEYGKLNKIDPASPTYKKLTGMLDRLAKSDPRLLKKLAGAKIKFVSPLAQNRVNRMKESVELDEATNTRVVVDVNRAGYRKLESMIASLDGYRESEFDAKQERATFHFDAKKNNNAQRKKVAEFIKKTRGADFHHSMTEELNEAGDPRIAKMSRKAQEILAMMANSLDTTGGPYLDKTNVKYLTRRGVENTLKAAQRIPKGNKDAWKDIALVKKELGESVELEEMSAKAHYNKMVAQGKVGGQVVSPIDRKRFPNREREGLEGPYRVKKSGLIYYYDKKAGKYYDPQADMYLQVRDIMEETEDQKPLITWMDKFEKALKSMGSSYAKVDPVEALKLYYRKVDPKTAAKKLK